MRYYSVSEPDHTCAWRFTSVSVIRTSTFQLLCILFNSFVFILENLENMGKYTEYMGFPHSSVGQESACNAGDPNLIPGSGRSPGEGNSSTHSIPTPVFLPRESHGQRSLAGFSPWGHKSRTLLSN